MWVAMLQKRRSGAWKQITDTTVWGSDGLQIPLLGLHLEEGILTLHGQKTHMELLSSIQQQVTEAPEVGR